MFPKRTQDRQLTISFRMHQSLDGLSLAMFEALRGLRDAVAPESGNLGNLNQGNEQGNGTDPHNIQQQQTQHANTDELWSMYQARDPYILQMTQGIPEFSSQSEFVDWYTTMLRQKDSALVESLASAVLRQSAAIDEAVDTWIPGMHRNRTEQMARIENLIEENNVAVRELEAAYDKALERRNLCRRFVQDTTSLALGIEEEK